MFDVLFSCTPPVYLDFLFNTIPLFIKLKKKKNGTKVVQIRRIGDVTMLTKLFNEETINIVSVYPRSKYTSNSQCVFVRHVSVSNMLRTLLHACPNCVERKKNFNLKFFFFFYDK